MDEKISQLNSLTTADQADLYAIVDTSASETKKITQQNVELSIANSTNFTDALVANTNFVNDIGDALVADATFVTNIGDALIADPNFTTDLANDSNFYTTLGNNTNFGDILGDNTGLINTLTNNATFQTNVNNFATGGGGIGNISSVTFQYPFLATAAATACPWDMSGASSFFGSSAASIGNAGRIQANSTDYDSLFPNSTTGGTLNFNGGKQVKFQATVITFDSALGGIGFNDFANAAIVTAQGTNTLSVGFVRSAGGQWFARSGTGAAFTETSITITDGTHVFRCEYDPGNGTPQARYYVDNILLATITTNIPSAVNTIMGFAVGNDTQAPISFVTAPLFSVEI